ncbi:hypothetical protein FPRO03_14081 [Fusarium proliferatum]|nr:hypothetical protein FPRO03_14081 [Fusarium proliferatum]
MSLVADMPHPFANSRSTPPPSPSASTISASNRLEIENRETALAARLITAVKKLVENKLGDNRPASTENPEPTVRNVNPIQETPGPSNWTGPFSSEPVVLQDQDFLICGPTVLGFCLGGKKFLEFAVAHISDITWMPSSYDDVKIPDAQNLFLFDLQRYGRSTWSRGQIGVDPVQVENILTNTFKIAGRWKAILLLDEADVFVSQRSNNPQVNALSFDTAMMSRIHLALEYKQLGIDSRRAVWKLFLEKARTQHGTSNLTELVDIVAHKKLNGREIRNTVLVAQSMAVYEGTVVCEGHLMESITARE